MSLFRDFEAELDRQREKLAESWSVLTKTESHDFDAENYDVPRFQTLQGKVDIHSVHIKGHENLADYQVELVANIIERMKIASSLLLAQSAYGLKADPTPAGLPETIDQDFESVQLMAGRREELRTGRFHPGAMDVAVHVPSDTLISFFQKIADNVDRFQSGEIPTGLQKKPEGKLLANIFELRADFAHTSMEYAEIRHGRADYLISAAVALKKWAIQDGVDRARLNKTLDEITHEARDNLEAVAMIHERTRKFMVRLFEMGDGQTMDVAKATRYEPVSIKPIVDPAP